MKLHSMGIAHAHDSKFQINRPNGSGDNLLLIFLTDALVQVDNELIHVSKNSAILYSKNSPQIYKCDGDIYVNHWVHFDCAETDIFFKNIKMEFNHPVKVNSSQTIEKILKLLSLEQISSESSSEQSAELILKLLITKVFGEMPKSNTSIYSNALQKMRAEIYSAPSHKYAVDKLAKSLSISTSHFQNLYKKEFGVSCYEDILRAKLMLACYYLTNTDVAVSTISELCGYENDVHFMRQFKKRIGISAGKYRKQNSE